MTGLQYGLYRHAPSVTIITVSGGGALAIESNLDR